MALSQAARKTRCGSGATPASFFDDLRVLHHVGSAVGLLKKQNTGALATCRITPERAVAQEVQHLVAGQVTHDAVQRSGSIDNLEPGLRQLLARLARQASAGRATP